MPTVLSQTLAFSDFDVLVVENGPAAGARNIVEKAAVNAFGAKLRYVHEPTPGLLSGRHRGALEALGDILVFADDDIDASPGWLSAILDAVGRTGRVVVADEDYVRGGLSGEVAAVLMEAGVPAKFARVAVETTIPFAPHLEYDALPNAERIAAAAKSVA